MFRLCWHHIKDQLRVGGDIHFCVSWVPVCQWWPGAAAGAKQLAQVSGWDTECLAASWVARPVPVAVGLPSRDGRRQAKRVSCQGPCWGTALDLQLHHTEDHLHPLAWEPSPAQFYTAMPDEAQSGAGGTRVASKPDTVNLMKFCHCTATVTPDFQLKSPANHLYLKMLQIEADLSDVTLSQREELIQSKIIVCCLVTY